MKKGFTLVELILYVAIIGIVMSAMLPVTWEVVGGGSRSMTDQEVAATGRNILERIKYEIRNAKNITNVAANSLVLTNYSGPDTTIDLNTGRVRINQGAGAISLNSDDTTVTDLIFTDYSSGDGKTKNVQVVLTLSANFSAAGRQEFQETMTLQTTTELRGI
ncbi:MAG: hypothetical protein UX91_C0004G0065 [Candidatus Amesbacteria bacterium GW2011_GWB1_47_19]|nr:MAG: hypothetical protein UW51_C0005G0065 [Candidatus Amesbacteria bacterium GW2011_GWA1_44_24]KKU31622.1 MAG: hypothetical protein UX46_C0004G0065 [Candidatus Amesbacteria bacterium GW2011_GWC1_46_24]KKU67395.1 MAG: hypothetical protein UX91_C0004G0065 [Candidatus Amesbacteria bacterium GW2011_GWB1_47_19]OGD05387.1 MAG: hypothetical protein A2379_05410 [Candidatus Amesbacteria bacterium RIFOXYB1_FULL_47_13]